MIKKYADFCYEQVGSYSLENLEYFESIRPQLTKADIEVSLPEYVSMIFFSTVMATAASAIFFTTLLLLSSGISGLFFGIALSAVTGTLTLMGFYLYPTIKIRDRATKIDDRLPFAVMYLSTLAGTGTSIPKIFQNLADAEEYGELAKEAEKIHRDIEVFGMDISKALKKGAERSPSEDLEEVLWGMEHVITTGGSLRSFLKERSSILMGDYKRRVEEFSDQLSLLVEVYIILVIVGSIIFTSMSVVLTSIGGFSDGLVIIIQALSVFVGLPILSLFFIIVVDAISPGGIE